MFRHYLENIWGTTSEDVLSQKTSDLAYEYCRHIKSYEHTRVLLMLIESALFLQNVLVDYNHHRYQQLPQMQN